MAKERDLVLIHVEDEPAIFARIESILPDKKRDWYHVNLLILEIPPTIATWILRKEYIQGQDFTMGGQKMKLELIKSLSKSQNQQTKETPPKKQKQGEVISIEELRKK